VGNTVFAVNPAVGSSWSAIDCGRRKWGHSGFSPLNSILDFGAQ
jgi:hypothetical protein